MRILHVVHDFLPRHRAGAEIYVAQLCRQLRRAHDVQVLCADYEPRARHGTLRYRQWDGIRVCEVVNNWRFHSFEQSYDGGGFRAAVDEVLAGFTPDVVHVHSLLTLGLCVVDAAGERHVPVAMTLHDYSLVCPSGGKRVHLREEHVCREIDFARCARCFPQSALHLQVVAATRVPTAAGRALLPLARAIAQRAPGFLPVIRRTAGRIGPHPGADDIARRMDRMRRAAACVQVAVAPSASLGAEFSRYGFFGDRLEVSDYGYPAFQPLPRRPASLPLRLGFVGTLAWEKGVHVLIEAVRRLDPGDYELHVFGALSTSPDYVRRLKSRANGLPVVFHGGFEADETPRVFAAFDVLVVPSVWMENSPLVIHESFIARVPVVAAREGGMPALLGDGAHGLLYDSGNAGELAAILQGLIDDPGAIDRMSARLPVVKSIERDVHEWEMRYRRLINGGATRQTTGTPQ